MTGVSKLLTECEEIAAVKLSAALVKVSKLASSDLLELTDQVKALSMRRIYNEAREFIRDQGPLLEDKLSRALLQRFQQEGTRSRHLSKASRLDAAQLMLVEPDDLEESLAASNVANAINNACGEELFGLVKRVGVLLNDPELEPFENPIRPEVIGEVLMNVLKEQETSVKVRLILVPLINKYFPEHVRETYQELNLFLVEHEILPTIRVTLKRTKSLGVEQLEVQDLYSQLQQLMAFKNPAQRQDISSTNFTPNFSQSYTPQVDLSGLLTALTQLQRSNDLNFNAGQASSLQDLKGALDHGDQLDSMMINVVTMIFDYILDDKRIPDAMKALIGRLQIPMLKVGMLDRGFFSHKSHPARKFLNALAEASIGWVEAESRESGLYKKIDDLIQQVLNSFDADVNVFSTALDELSAYRREETRLIAEVTSLSAGVIQVRERAFSDAQEVVIDHLYGNSVPDLIKTFLREHWVQYLSVHAKGSPNWNDAVQTMDVLIWSTTVKTDPSDRKKLISLLPSLIKSLDAGLRQVGFIDAHRDAFFGGLVKCHALAIKGTLNNNVEVNLDSLREVQENLDLEEIKGLDAVQVDDDLVKEIASVIEEDLEEITVSDVSWLAGGSGDGDEADVDNFEETVRAMKRGTWVEFQQDDGSILRTKLAWTSPLKGSFLFTNRLGGQAMVINVEGLALKFRLGDAKVINNVPLMDRAVNSLLERLRVDLSAQSSP